MQLTDIDMRRVRVSGGFWGRRLQDNAHQAIFYQWEQLERTRCIDNFRIAAGRLESFHEGMFFADSDAYKWLDAASRILASGADPLLAQRVDEFISLLESAQMRDGYLYTYNQILFPGQRWVNLRLEHELYCHGHLVEAGVAHHAATGQTRLLNLVRRSADLLVRDFMDATPEQADGHEEIEIALVRLHRATGEGTYLELARRLLERRGQARGNVVAVLRQLVSAGRRMRSVAKRRKLYRSQHPEPSGFVLPAGNKPKIPPLAPLRMAYNMLSGRFFQQNLPVRQQTVPVGHAVCFTYLQTATAMLSGQTGDAELRAATEQAWERTVTRHMYVTGGLGSIPLVEGFGRDYELDPETAYAETCAAIGGLLWNHEMALLSGQPRYDDLFEWQLYNAASVGIGMDMRSYFYNNPLTCRGGITRAPWYFIPCCPSNLSRIWAALGQYAYRIGEHELYVSQYIDSQINLDWGNVQVDTTLPWGGEVRLTLDPVRPARVALRLRLPSWSSAYDLRLNGSPIEPDTISSAAPESETACGYAPHAARIATVTRVWTPGDVLELILDMPLRLHRQHHNVPRCGGMHALSRGPLVYCLESIDNPGDVFAVKVRRDSLTAIEDKALLAGIHKIEGRSDTGEPLTFVPYMLWGNRGASLMTVFFAADGSNGKSACATGSIGMTF